VPGYLVVLAHLPSDVGPPCPLRSLTGIPCPFCGLTTALRELGGGHLVRSVSAAPLGILLAILALLALAGRLPPRLKLAYWGIVPLLGAEWLYELSRFQVI
jgi:hypothetical protein